jgi:hypothetical protein
LFYTFYDAICYVLKYILENKNISHNLVVNTDYTNIQWEDYLCLKEIYGFDGNQLDFVDDVLIDGDIVDMKNEPHFLELKCNKLII